jgi:quinoprotein glucose dehydrogenase
VRRPHGQRLWIFKTIPSPGEFGNETWEKDSWSYSGNTGVWAQMTVDEELGLVYMPVELPTGDYYGGHRPGNSLFSESLVAVDLNTGKRKWHYQLVHHGIWDFDIPCAPILADLNVDGKVVKAVAQPTKQGWVYVFDRVTGQPVWSIEERPVEKGEVPGEWYSPTQPFVSKPPAFERQGVSIDDLIDFTPELRAEAVKLVSKYKFGPIFTPPVVSRWEGPLATLVLPSATGGPNWPGGALDPETNFLYIYSFTNVNPVGLVADPARSDMAYISGRARDNAPAPASGGPGAAAPAGGARVEAGSHRAGPAAAQAAVRAHTAIDLNRVRSPGRSRTADAGQHSQPPGAQGLSIPRTGRSQRRISTLVTKTLVIAEASFFTTKWAAGRCRTADATGRSRRVYMPAPQPARR